MEHVHRLHFLSRGDELDWLSGDVLDGKRGAASGVTVHLRKHDSVKIKPLVEDLGGLHRILTGHRIDHEQGLCRIHGLVQGRDLVHQLLIHSQTSGGVYDDHRITLGLGLCYGVLGDPDRVLDTILGVNRNLDSLTEHLQLFDCGRAERVAGGEEHLHPSLALDVVRQLGRERGLTGTVQTRDQNYSRIALDVDVLRRAAHKVRKLVVDDLDHHLLRLHGREDILSHRLDFHLVAEVFGHAEAYVSVQQRPADVLKRLRDIDLGDFTLALQNLEGSLKPFL